jgi:hypothetical protein
VDPVTNRIYAADETGFNITIIDGATGGTTTVATGIQPNALAANPVTGTIYVTNQSGGSVTAITGQIATSVTLSAAFDTTHGHFTANPRPALTGKGVNRMRPGHSGILAIGNARSSQIAWQNASIVSGGGTDSAQWIWNWGSDSLVTGENYLCALPIDSLSATTNDIALGMAFTGNVAVFPYYCFPLHAPLLSSPANGAANQRASITLSWGAVAGIASYTVQVSTSGTFTSTISGQSGLTAASLTLTGIPNAATYYWRVTGVSAAFGNGPWSSVWSFATMPANSPAPPIIAAPGNGAADQPVSLTFSWSSLAVALNYTFQLSSAGSFSSTVLQDTTLTGSSKAVSGLSNSATYYWRVQARNDYGSSAWSSALFTTIVLAPVVPVLSAPTNGAVGLVSPLALSWSSVPTTVSYRVQVSTGSDFGNLYLDDSSLSFANRIVPALCPGITYYWHANARNDAGAGAWSGSWSFTASQLLPLAPILAAPASGSTGQPVSPALTWGTVSGAVSYALQVSTASSFSTTAISQAGITGSSCTIGPLASGASYYWQAQAVSAAGTGLWSGAWSFTTMALFPALSLPANGAAGQNLSLSLQWGAMDGALSYRVRLATDSLFTSLILDDSMLTARSQAVTGLDYVSTYYWQVRATTAIGAGPWCPAWNFTTTTFPPAVPVLALPTNGAKNQPMSISLAWGRADDAALYTVQLSTAGTFAATLIQDTLVTDTVRAFSGLAGNITYFWRVGAKNASGLGSGWSGTWSFTTTLAHFAIPLQSGWFMYSLNIQPADSSTNGVFSGLKGFILAMDGSDNLYWPGAPLDEIGTLHTGSGYWVLDTLSTDTLKLAGNSVNLTTTPEPLQASSWNLVSYLPQVSMPIATALAPIDSQLVLAMDGASNFYWPAASLNEIGTMTVGNGYYIVTSAAASLTYPTAGSSPAKLLAASPATAKLLSPSAPKHFAKRALTGNFAAFMAPHVEIGGKLAADNCEVGAYDTKGNLVGSGTVVNGLVAFAICGKDPAGKVKNGCLPSEKLTFKLWNGKTEYPLEVTRGSEPVFASRTILKATLAVPAGALISAFNLSRAYPNPFKGVVNIAFDVPTLAGVAQHAIEINIYDMKGDLVKQLAKGVYQAGHYELPWNCNESREGGVGSSMYIVRMKAANFEKRLTLIRVE